MDGPITLNQQVGARARLRTSSSWLVNSLCSFSFSILLLFILSRTLFSLSLGLSLPLLVLFVFLFRSPAGTQMFKKAPSDRQQSACGRCPTDPSFPLLWRHQWWVKIFFLFFFKRGEKVSSEWCRMYCQIFLSIPWKASPEALVAVLQMKHGKCWVDCTAGKLLSPSPREGGGMEGGV